MIAESIRALGYRAGKDVSQHIIQAHAWNSAHLIPQWRKGHLLLLRPLHLSGLGIIAVKQVRTAGGGGVVQPLREDAGLGLGYPKLAGKGALSPLNHLIAAGNQRLRLVAEDVGGIGYRPSEVIQRQGDRLPARQPFQIDIFHFLLFGAGHARGGIVGVLEHALAS